VTHPYHFHSLGHFVFEAFDFKIQLRAAIELFFLFRLSA
jgi:hypothetical protein